MATSYTVQTGDCISSIAYDNGLFWETLWNHPSNASLKALRKDPNILQVGDTVFIPDLTARKESGAPNSRHTYQIKGVPAKLILRILQPAKPLKSDPPDTGPVQKGDGKDDLLEDPDPVAPKPDEPRANAPYILELDDGRSIQGKTDGQGQIKCAIFPNVRTGRLFIDRGTPDETIIPLALGALAPITELGGVKQRLANLGLGVDDASDDETPELAAALQLFQSLNSLPVTGEADQATRDKLKSLHGC